jgi:hypothetical protein
LRIARREGLAQKSVCGRGRRGPISLCREKPLRFIEVGVPSQIFWAYPSETEHAGCPLRQFARNFASRWEYGQGLRAFSRYKAQIRVGFTGLPRNNSGWIGLRAAAQKSRFT